MDDLFIQLDFSKVNSPALGLGISVLKRGLHTAIISEFKHFPAEGQNKESLYMHMDSEGLRHRDRFGLEAANLPFLAGAITSAGIDPKQYAGKKLNFPFHKLSGRTVYFFYEPPQLDENGNPAKGKYAKYSYFTKEMFQEELKRAAAAPAPGTEFEPPAQTTTAAPVAAPVAAVVAQPAPVVTVAPVVAAPVAAKPTDDFSFLADD